MTLGQVVSTERQFLQALGHLRQSYRRRCRRSRISLPLQALLNCRCLNQCSTVSFHLPLRDVAKRKTIPPPLGFPPPATRIMTRLRSGTSRRLAPHHPFRQKNDKGFAPSICHSRSPLRAEMLLRTRRPRQSCILGCHRRRLCRRWLPFVEHQAPVWIGPIIAALKAMQYFFSPLSTHHLSGAQPEDGPRACKTERCSFEAAAVLSSSIKIPDLIEHQILIR